MTHRNARLTPVTRAELVERVTDGWPQAEVARLFRATVAKVGAAVPRRRTGRALRPLQPSPAQPPPDRSVAGSSHLRCTPVFRLGATPHRVAVGHRPLHRLAWLHRTTGRVGLPATYYSNRQRLDALPRFLAYSNHRRPHGTRRGYSRLTPVNNVLGNYT